MVLPRRRGNPSIACHCRRRGAAEEARLPGRHARRRWRPAFLGGRARLPEGGREPGFSHLATWRAGLCRDRRHVRLPRKKKIIVEGDSFINTLVSYDAFTPGTNFNPVWLEPFAVTLDKFQVRFDRESRKHVGQPIDFTAALTTRDRGDAPPSRQILKVNEPVYFGETGMFLVGNGYAPVVTVKDGTGKTAFSGPVVSVPSDGVYTSSVVIKAPDAAPSQLGFVGFFLPSAIKTTRASPTASTRTR